VLKVFFNIESWGLVECAIPFPVQLEDLIGIPILAILSRELIEKRPQLIAEEKGILEGFQRIGQDLLSKGFRPL
jgi:hypothetical protein